MNEELSENVELGNTAEEKNREVYERPRIILLDFTCTNAGGVRSTDLINAS